MSTEAQTGKVDFIKSFSDAAAIANYHEGPPRFMPGIEAMRSMTSILLAEVAPDDARVLVLGAGGGMEIKTLATAHPGWSFVGVDPAKAMLDLAERTLGPLMNRVELVHGYIDDAPAGPFDAATCLLTLHFLDAPTRVHTLRAIHQRLKSGAPFVAAHSSFPQDAASRPVWLKRYAAFAIASGADPEQANGAREAVGANLALFDPERDEDLMRESGFADPELFYAAFTWRGWIAHA
ncbi:MAG: class I SAM-dependent methyltransferase [Parvibaculum sp.]|nr:class I SAM-dependent methyltransferase [Parvibaculum sp.]